MQKRIHILGICGTFMGSLALLARELGFVVEGSDQSVYPPMSEQLAAQGIHLTEGYSAGYLKNPPDLVVVGNTIKRGNPAMEALLNCKLPYVSGPEFLKEHVLKGRHVLAVAGTHGKTTTASMLAWILEYAGLEPGFLIGGVPLNFGISARLGQSPYFVIEADEYDTAFFDKRSKFIHYRPDTLVLNNLEFDHADIFDNVAHIQKHFHHLIRTVAANALIIDNAQDPLLQEAIHMGCFTPRLSINGPSSEWRAQLQSPHAFAVYFKGNLVGECHWDLLGEHNVHNALSALVAATHVGVDPIVSLKALEQFLNVKRRMELKASIHGIDVYDDFAHHPTAIKTTLAGLRSSIGTRRILAVTEFASNTMRSGVHKESLGDAFDVADAVYCLKPAWPLEQSFRGRKPQVADTVDALVLAVVKDLKKEDVILVMSNSGFGGLHEKLLQQLKVYNF